MAGPSSQVDDELARVTAELHEAKAKLASVEEKIGVAERAMAAAKARGDGSETSGQREKELLLEAQNWLLQKETLLLADRRALRDRAPAARGAQIQPQLSGAERFQALLVGAGVEAEPHVLRTIAESAVLSTQATMCTTPDVAVTVYQLAAHVLRTRTKARVRREKNIVINGLMLVEGVQSALFFHAFERTVPRVLKVPLAQGRAAAECALWQELPPAVRTSAALVPVTYLELSGLHEAAPGSPATALREGILMPHYACTLANVPAPMEARWALATARRLAAALDTLHAHGWLHGDVKPANIFIDAHEGHAWLGDYGSSVRWADIGTYSGGTPAFQCADVTVATAPACVDRAGLAISMLSALGMLSAERVPMLGFPRAALRAAVSRIAQELPEEDALAPLQSFLSSLLDAPPAVASSTA